MKHYFALDMPAVHFVRNTLIISVISLVPLLFLYVFLIPGFAAHWRVAVPRSRGSCGKC